MDGAQCRGWTVYSAADGRCTVPRMDAAESCGKLNLNNTEKSRKVRINGGGNRLRRSSEKKEEVEKNSGKGAEGRGKMLAADGL
ncbi:hypothetical protein CYMTET_23916 [Cymbomonas tetramitiformis]|uniref:Uncharacterized protein n=1 Tax=Cymbomonas tetramitiformis TaxID=36881 RepID=A0AAE0FX52_9CHLO|nr:hypothetical protein CYMTET_23916 [Cymbomonas tetramitiformis]